MNFIFRVNLFLDRNIALPLPEGYINIQLSRWQVNSAAARVITCSKAKLWTQTIVKEQLSMPLPFYGNLVHANRELK